MRERKPWATDPRYFKHVKISALALLKMAMHGNKFSKVLHIVTLHNKYIRVLTFSEFLSARSGGQMEVMGILQGKLEDNTFVVMDAFALPVEGTESKTFAKSLRKSPAVRLLAPEQGAEKCPACLFFSPPPHFTRRGAPRADSPLSKRSDSVQQNLCPDLHHFSRVSWASRSACDASGGGV